MEEIKKTEMDVLQPEQYSEQEIQALKSFIEVVKNDETRSALACWGNHSDYSKGY